MAKARITTMAREVGVSKDTLFEYLRSARYAVENKPTFYLDDAMIEAVNNRFRKEKEAVATQRAKIEKQKELASGPRVVVDASTSGREKVRYYQKEVKLPVEPRIELPIEKHIPTLSPVIEKVHNIEKELVPEEANDAVVVEEIENDLPKEVAADVEAERNVEVEHIVNISTPKELTNLPDVGTVINVEGRGDRYKSRKLQERDKDKDKESFAKPKSEKGERKNTKGGKNKEKIERQESKLVSVSAKTREEKPLPKIERKDEKHTTLHKISHSQDKKQNVADTKQQSKFEKPKFKIDTSLPKLQGLTVVGKIDITQGDRTMRSRGDNRGKFGKDDKNKKQDNKPVFDKDKGKGGKFRSNEGTYTASPNTRSKIGTIGDNWSIEGTSNKTGKFSAQPAKPKVQDYDNKKKKKTTRAETFTSADVDRAIKDALMEMEETRRGNKQNKKRIKHEKEERTRIKIEEQHTRAERESNTLKLSEFVTTADLAALMNIKPNEIILKCMQLGLMVTINQRLDKDTIQLVADDYGFEVAFVEENTLDDVVEEEIDTEESLKSRPPIVTIMGHVDHGKTSLLDYIRNENVVAGEAGGITQHIGAYRVLLKNGKAITFLDTPGHAAFTAMRARGAQVTDIVVIVVAADDSVMPQTIEAISHAKAADVPIIIAINKIDKSEANVDKIKQQLSDHSILVEDWGGKYQCAEISAKKGINIDGLLDKILLEAEILDLRANPNRNAQGVVLESKMTKGWGNVASVVVQRGTLWLSDNFVAGANFGKVRALLDERGNKVSDVLPSQPVVVVGIDGLPEAGDSFVVVNSDVEAREIATKRKQLRREQDMRKVHHTTLDDISAQIAIGGVKDLNIVIKGDVAGSVEALSDSLLKLSTEEVRVNIVLKGAGIISESDVMLASASHAIVIGFNINSTPQAAKLAENESVEIRNYNIIYNCITDIQLALEGLLRPDIKEETLATIEVRQIFKISKIGQIAGCYVLDGKVTRNDKIRILRDGFPIFSSSIGSLKRNKDDVKEVDAKYECGIQISNFNSFEVGDIIEAYKLVEVKRKLTK